MLVTSRAGMARNQLAHLETSSPMTASTATDLKSRFLDLPALEMATELRHLAR